MRGRVGEEHEEWFLADLPDVLDRFLGEKLLGIGSFLAAFVFLDAFLDAIASEKVRILTVSLQYRVRAVPGVEAHG